MDRYRLGRVLGKGSYGTVWEAVCLEDGREVAVKELSARVESWDACLQLREVQVLRHLEPHPNVVRLLEVVWEAGRAMLVFERMECNLHEYAARRGPLEQAEVRNMARQILSGLRHVHASGLVHRDLKPENVLFRAGELKISDFGLARRLADQRPLTEYISTRWYRAPELLLRLGVYGPQVDVWAAAAIIAELAEGKPLFPGRNEIDQLRRVFSTVGQPSPTNWPQGKAHMSRLGFQFRPTAHVSLSALMRNSAGELRSLVDDMLRLDPAARPSASRSLSHPYLRPRSDPPGGSTFAFEEESGRGEHAVLRRGTSGRETADWDRTQRLLRTSAGQVRDTGPSAAEHLGSSRFPPGSESLHARATDTRRRGGAVLKEQPAGRFQLR